METVSRLVNRPPVPLPAAAAPVASACIKVAHPVRAQCQSLRLSSPDDAAELEARSVARQVVSMPARQTASRPGTLRSPATLARSQATPPAHAAPTPATPAARLSQPTSGGEALPESLRRDMEPRFGADFSRIRIHRDARAAQASRQLNAAAFTIGHQIYFGQGQWQPDSAAGRELIAHELTHTIQQGAAGQIRRSGPTAVAVNSPPAVQRLGMGDALNYFADAANAIPGYRMFTILIGINPINMNAVEASAANILRALVEFLPGGFVITRVLDSHGIFDRVGGWIEAQLKSLGITGAAIRAAVNAFLESLSWRDILALGSLWERAKSIFTTPITRIIAFAKSLFGEILRFVREAVLRPLARLAEGTAGYGLLKAVIGFDPITGEAVPRTAETIIGGFMTMIGQQELWENIKRANAIPRAWAWFQVALGGLMGLVRSIPDRFMAALRSLEIIDFVVLPSAFVKLAKVFGGFLVNFGSWALGTVINLLQIIVEVVAPGVMPYLRKAAGAFKTIIANPVRFVQTLVRAAVQGFQQFASRFLTHLQASLIGWLTGALGGAGLYLPKSLAPMELVKFVLSVLGLTWTNIRGKLVAATSETVVTALETGFDIVRTLVSEGPAAAWQKIVETLTNLKQMAIDAIMDFVKSKVVDAAITKLLSLLSPAGALIQAIIATYNTIMFFVERLSQIAQVAAAFIDGIAAIAAGNIAPAANRVEQTMAGLLTLVISFLARIAGLGKVADAVTELIAKIRAPIDKALDKVVAWIVNLSRRFISAVRGAAVRVAQWWLRQQRFRASDGHNHSLYFVGEGRAARLTISSDPMPVEVFIASIESRPECRTPEKRALIAQVRQQVRAIQNAQALPEAEASQAETQMAIAFAAITPLLMQLLDGPAFGTEEQPLPMPYPKRRWSAYPPIYIGPLSENRITQADLRNNRKADIRASLNAGERAAWLREGEPIRALRPGETTTLPTGATIGIQGNYRAEPGLKLRLVPGSTQGGGLINGIFRPYGYRALSESLDGDHVIEMQIGGPNALPNMWPLTASENRSSGSRIASMNLTKPDGAQISMESLKARARSGVDVWLLITATL